MTQSEMERELSNRTGESIATIRNHGFGLVEVPDMEPLTVDWDAVQQVEPTRVPLTRRRRSRQAA